MFWILAAICTLCVLGNAAAVIASLRGRHVSLIPLIGGVAGLLASHVAPWPELAAWAWVPPLADLGTSLVSVGIVMALVQRRRPLPPTPILPMRILLVENHPAFASTVATTFLADHHVEIVPSIRGALAAIRDHPFDVALVDFDLDDGKGDELVRWAKRSARHLALVAISARDDGNAALLLAGAHAACSKLEFGRIQYVLQQVRPDGGQQGFRWRLARSDRIAGRPANQRLADRLVAAVLMFMAEHEAGAMTVAEVKPHSTALAMGQTLDRDAVCDIIRACLREELWCRLEAGDLAIHVGRYFLYIESERDCPQALELARNDFELAVESVQYPAAL
ncbi:MAG TPA: response regulator [Kofleriaceae bacterium]